MIIYINILFTLRCHRCNTLEEERRKKEGGRKEERKKERKREIIEE